MESKVIDAMKAFISSQNYALGRQISIDDRRFEDAMTCHFFFKMYVDEYFDIKESMTQDERNRLMAARTCLDYSYIYN
jgi:hypothetical protein